MIIDQEVVLEIEVGLGVEVHLDKDLIHIQIIINNTYTSYRNLSFNKNWISNRSYEHYFVNFYNSSYWNLLRKI